MFCRPLWHLTQIASLCAIAVGLADTDTITWGGDVSRSGYQNNHNMDPAVVGSAQFGQIFRTVLPGRYGGIPEQVFASPLVYTTGDGIQYVYLATQQNNIYKLNAKTGVIVASRNLHIPFLTSDLDGCVDINPHIGSTATGVIDPSTNTWYLTTKTYIDQNPSGAKGRPNGRYYFHAINVNDLSERPNFPVDLEFTIARNNPERMFTGGIHHQRPALLHQGQYIYAGFASHCVQYNFTGWIMGWDKSSGQIVERYATEGAGVKNTVPGGGVWMSGGGLASDGRGSMFFSTGNGYASQLNGIPVSSRQPPTSLEEAAVHMTINSDGSLTPVDFFMPWEKTQLDGADKDLGTSPLQLLPSQFSCGSVRRIGVVTGKSGKTYWIDMDNMGGYQNGPNKLDSVLQVYQNENSVYAGAGVYPLEGGYIYINVIQYQTHVFKFSCDGGVPSFTKVADSPEKNAYILGVGHGTVTSLRDQPGTGLVWTSDVENSNLRIYNAVPQNGLMTLIKSFVIPGTTKFQRPVFGDGIVYHTTHLGYFYGFGSPVNNALNCSSPYDFGTVDINSTSPVMTISCKALVNTQVTGLSINGNKNFILGNSTITFPVTVPLGGNFSFQAAFKPGQVGPLSSDVLVNTTTAGTTYSSSTPVGLRGVGQSVNAILSLSPNTVSFDGVITGQQGASDRSIILLNQGNSNLTIADWQCSTETETGPFTSISVTNGSLVCGAFTFTRLPIVIAGNSQSTVNVAFNPSVSGNYAAFLAIQSNGGRKVLTVVGVAGTFPSALLEFQNPNGTGWIRYDNSTPFDFGDVLENTSRNLKMRLTNAGGNSSTRLSITVSKPPFGVSGIIGAQNQVDLGEGIALGPGESATATLYCSPPKSQINVDAYVGTAQWTMNLGDPNFGKQFIQFRCNAISEQAPPLFPNGTSQYRYRGCYKENNPTRQMKMQIYGANDNTNQMCVKACSDAGYAFAGTQYQRECWCSPYIPTVKVDDANCNFPCSGNVNQICGGNGIDHAGTYISLFLDSTKLNSNGLQGPVVNPGVNNYTSLGCYTEATAGRALSIGKAMGGYNSVANCTAACRGYTYAGVEYGGECFCGNTIATGSVPAPIEQCNMICNGNSSEFCGAGSRLNMYMFRNVSTSTSTSTSASISTSSSASVSASISASANITMSVNVTSTSTSFSANATSSVAPTSPDNSTITSSANSTVTSSSEPTSSTNATITSSASFSANTTITSSVSSSANASITSDTSSSSTSANATVSVSNSTSASASSTSSSASSSLMSSSASATSTSTSTSTSSSASPTPTGPIQPAKIGSWVFLNCTTEPSAGRALTGRTLATDKMTLELCASTCAGFKYFGTEYERECYCGNTIASGSTVATDGRCKMTCMGNRLQICGGPVGLSMYVFDNSTVSSSSLMSTSISTSTSVAPPSSSSSSSSAAQVSSSSSAPVSSSSESPSASAVASSSSTSSTASALSPSLSNAPSSSASTSSTSSSSSPVSSSSASSSESSSSSSPSQSASSSVSTTPSSSAPVSSSSSSSISSPTVTPSSSSSSSLSTTSSTSSSSASPSPSSLPNWQYLGCANETNPRALNLAGTATSTMTVKECQTFCASKNYPLAGLEYGQECYCGIALQSFSTLGYTGCNMPCAGSSSEICGGPSRLSVYNYTAFIPPRLVPTVGLYTLQGCYAEPSGARALPSYTFVNATGMTAEWCVSGCEARGYSWAGVEYGKECWCGQSLNARATKVADSQCNMVCPGNRREYCGAGSRIGVYSRSGKGEE